MECEPALTVQGEVATCSDPRILPRLPAPHAPGRLEVKLNMRFLYNREYHAWVSGMRVAAGASLVNVDMQK